MLANVIKAVKLTMFIEEASLDCWKQIKFRLFVCDKHCTMSHRYEAKAN